LGKLDSDGTKMKPIIMWFIYSNKRVVIEIVYVSTKPFSFESLVIVHSRLYFMGMLFCKSYTDQVASKITWLSVNSYNVVFDLSCYLLVFIFYLDLQCHYYKKVPVSFLFITLFHLHLNTISSFSDRQLHRT